MSSIRLVAGYVHVAGHVEGRFVFVLGGRFGRDQRAALRTEQRVDAVAVGLERAADDDLVLFGRLQRQAEAVVPVEVVAVRRAAQVGLVEHARRLLVACSSRCRPRTAA